MAGPEVTGAPPKPGKCVKVSLFLKKLPGVTDEYFHAYWANNHLIPAMKNETFMSKTRRYNQHHITHEFREKAKEFGIPVLEYDGVAEVWIDSLEDWKAITSDTEFVKEVAADELHFIQYPINIMFGYDNLVIGEDWKTKYVHAQKPQ